MDCVKILGQSTFPNRRFLESDRKKQLKFSGIGITSNGLPRICWCYH